MHSCCLIFSFTVIHRHVYQGVLQQTVYLLNVLIYSVAKTNIWKLGEFLLNCSFSLPLRYSLTFINDKVNEFEIIWLSNILNLNVPEEGYSRNASCALNCIFMIVLASCITDCINDSMFIDLLPMLLRMLYIWVTSKIISILLP